jgi:ABC-type molybdate transport system substrate-binding protein
MQSRFPFYIASAIVAALALIFAAGVVSASSSQASIETQHAQTLVEDLLRAPLDYFTSDYENEAKQTAASPAQL